MNVYLLTETIDLGYSVIDVYRKLEDIPYQLDPDYTYKYTDNIPFKYPLIKDKLVPGSWSVVGKSGYHVYEYEVK